MIDKILIIEDTHEMRENIAEILSLAGYETHTAENGKIGLEQAKKVNPDLILCDIMMPELDGYGVLRAIENIPALCNTPLIFITAKSDISDFRKSMDLGADDYLVKPFSGDDIIKVVSARLKKNKMLRSSAGTVNETSLICEEKLPSFDDISLFLEHKTVKKIKKKEIIYREGDEIFFLYYIISGKVKSFITNDFGRDYLTDIYNAGDFFGYLSIIENKSQLDSTAAIEDSEIAFIPKQYFFEVLHSNNDLALKFIKHISDDLSHSEEKLLKLAYDSARKRTAEALLFIYHKYQLNEMGGNQIPVSREDISSIAGITVESVSRNLTNFREEGLIETSNNYIRIIDVNKLETIKN